MSWGGSPSCGFDLNSDGSETTSRRKKATKEERLLNWFEYFYERAKEGVSGNRGEANTSGAKQAYKEIKQLIKSLPKKRCKNCNYFIYQIHHNSRCKLDMEKRFNELRDGRASACEEWKKKRDREFLRDD